MQRLDALDKRYKNDVLFHELVKRLSYMVRNTPLTYADFRDAVHFAEVTDTMIERTKKATNSPPD